MHYNLMQKSMFYKYDLTNVLAIRLGGGITTLILQKTKQKLMKLNSHRSQKCWKSKSTSVS